MQRFRVTRTREGPDSTAGVLWKETEPGVWSRLCETLEDADGRPGKGRIPAGVYDLLLVTPEMQPGAKRNRRYAHDPRWRGAIVVCDVPGFSGIEIHAGSSHEHTEGCILVGDHHMIDGDGNYRFRSWGESSATFLAVVQPQVAGPPDLGVHCQLEITDP